MSLGLSKMDAQEIKNDQSKLAIIDTCYNFNKKVKYIKNQQPIELLKLELGDKIKNPDKFIHDYLEIKQDKTIIIKPNFINGLDLHINMNKISSYYGIRYTINF